MKKNNLVSVIIAAAGSADRLGIGQSKQFLYLKNKPLLFYSIEKFLLIKNIFEIIVVTNDIDSTKQLLKDKNIPNLKIVLGGKLRYESVYNGFSNVDSKADLVLIHDVARPLFNIKDVEKCIEKASLNGTAILAIPVTDTLKKIRSYNDELVVEGTVNRDNTFLVQTPQVIKYSLLNEAFELLKKSKEKKIVTDEATLIELLGKSVNLVIGSRKNIKITYPEDLEIADCILGQTIDNKEIETGKIYSGNFQIKEKNPV